MTNELTNILTWTLHDWQLTTSAEDTRLSNTTADFLQESNMTELTLPYGESKNYKYVFQIPKNMNINDECYLLLL